MRVVPVGNYEVTVDIDDTYEVIDAILTMETWVSKDEPGARIEFAYAGNEPFWYKFTKNGVLHRDGAPAHVLFGDNGAVIEETYANHGVPFDPLTTDGPDPTI